MRRLSGWAVAGAIVVSTIACDRASKHVAEQRLAGGGRRSYLADTVRVEFTENRGGFLSLGADLPPAARTAVFTVGTLALLAVLAATLGRRRHDGVSAVGLSLLWAGGVSNVIDRLLRGAVVDFLNVGIGPVRTGIFNLADVAITVGVAVLLVAGRHSAAQGADAERDG